jgi:hypothetical protein
MNNPRVLISLAQAKEVAEKNAFVETDRSFVDTKKILKEDYLEGEYCWMFFENDKEEFWSENNLGIRWAHVVSKTGEYSMVEDFSGDSLKLHAYLKTMSDYFKNMAMSSL